MFLDSHSLKCSQVTQFVLTVYAIFKYTKNTSVSFDLLLGGGRGPLLCAAQGG